MTIMTRGQFVATTLVGAILFVACSRYQYVNELDTPECKSRPQVEYVKASSIPDPSSDSTRWLRGVVVRMDNGEPLPGAQVKIRDGDSSMVLSDSIGQFALAGPVHRGSVHLDISRLGFYRYSDTIMTPLAPGVRWRVALAVFVNDGPCSGLLMVRVRKPWWKLW